MYDKLQTDARGTTFFISSHWIDQRLLWLGKWDRKETVVFGRGETVFVFTISFIARPRPEPLDWPQAWSGNWCSWEIAFAKWTCRVFRKLLTCGFGFWRKSKHRAMPPHMGLSAQSSHCSHLRDLGKHCHVDELLLCSTLSRATHCRWDRYLHQVDSAIPS